VAPIASNWVHQWLKLKCCCVEKSSWPDGGRWINHVAAAAAASTAAAAAAVAAATNPDWFNFRNSGYLVSEGNK